ncbi:S8 family serine peptidase [Geodermatophilus sp. URMC 60]
MGRGIVRSAVPLVVVATLVTALPAHAGPDGSPGSGGGVLPSAAPSPASGGQATAVPQATHEEDAATTVSAIVIRDGDAEVITREVGEAGVASVTADLRAEPGVVNVSVDTPVTMAAAADPHRSQQWALDDLAVDGLPADVPDGSGIVVAVVDTGVLASHEDLDGRVRCDLGADFASDAASVDPAGNGCVDPNGHGTHVTGEVSATAGNGVGIAGVSAVQIMPVRVLGADGGGTSGTVSSGIVHAVDNGADVVNLSLTGPYNTAYDAAVRYADEHGVVVVAAAGNNRQTGNQVNYPAASPGVISVAASDDDRTAAPFSYSGPTNTVTAPGVSILSTDSRRGYLARSGTSMAAPLVTGVVARYLPQHPGVTPAAVKAAVETTALDIGAPGRDDDTGHGLLGVHALLTGTPAPGATALPGAPTIGVPLAADGSVVVQWRAPPDDGSSPITGYTVEVFAGETVGRTATAAADSRTATVSGLVNGTSYRFRVRAETAVGSGPPSAFSAWVTPTPLGSLTDVTEGRPFAADIAWLVEMRIATGYADGTFRPGVPVSRQAMAAFLYRYAGSPAFTPPVTPTFADVPAAAPFHLEVEWLAAEGIATGTLRPDGTRSFGGSDPVSRQAMAAFLHRFSGADRATRCTGGPFADVPAGHRFCTEIAWLATTGVTTGYADGGFHPAAPVTRQAMAAFLHRLHTTGTVPRDG